ncbi:restriction endonuclease subunit S [Klebsiella huaxiensis]|uniref:restriction endonuclease subunit S n=1 Tax=Klebsiella huaxiensis TaxID=2153354 RepID=UPI003166C9E9
MSRLKGMLPPSWESVKLGQFVENEKGKKPKKQTVEKTAECNLPYVDIEAFEEGNIKSWTNGEGCRVCYESDFLMVWDGSRSGLVGKGMHGALGSTLVRINFPGMNNQYAYYFLLSKYQEINTRAKGSGTPHVDPDLLWNYEFLVAPISEQERIVAKIEELFSELDNGITALKTAREQLEVYRQAVLIYAFEGKLTKKWREHNNVAKSSWLDTTVQKLALSGPSNGRSVKDRAGGFPVLRLTALKNGKIDLNEFKEGAWDKDDAHNYIVSEGDFLFSRGNGSKHLVGRGGLVTKPLFDVAFPDTIMRISLDKTKVSPSFFSYLWESRLIRSQIEMSARTTAGIYKINQQHVKGFRLMLPSLTEQKVITEIIEEKLSVVDAQLDELEQQIAKAEILRQSILKKAFSGQLVPQDPNDEPASELLARIQAEKKAVNTQKTKKTRKIHSTPRH